MDIVSKIWVIFWFVMFALEIPRVNKDKDWIATIGAFIAVWALIGWIPAAIWLLL